MSLFENLQILFIKIRNIAKKFYFTDTSMKIFLKMFVNNMPIFWVQYLNLKAIPEFGEYETKLGITSGTIICFLTEIRIVCHSNMMQKCLPTNAQTLILSSG
jgi:hypothetical protein